MFIHRPILTLYGRYLSKFTSFKRDTFLKKNLHFSLATREVSFAHLSRKGADYAKR